MNTGQTAGQIICDVEFTRGTLSKPTGKIRFRLGTKFEFIKKKKIPREIPSLVTDSCSSSHENFSFQ